MPGVSGVPATSRVTPEPRSGHVNVTVRLPNMAAITVPVLILKTTFVQMDPVQVRIYLKQLKNKTTIKHETFFVDLFFSACPCLSLGSLSVSFSTSLSVILSHIDPLQLTEAGVLGVNGVPAA